MEDEDFKASAARAFLAEQEAVVQISNSADVGAFLEWFLTAVMGFGPNRRIDPGKLMQALVQHQDEIFEIGRLPIPQGAEDVGAWFSRLSAYGKKLSSAATADDGTAGGYLDMDAIKGEVQHLKQAGVLRALPEHSAVLSMPAGMLEDASTLMARAVSEGSSRLQQVPRELLEQLPRESLEHLNGLVELMRSMTAQQSARMGGIAQGKRAAPASGLNNRYEGQRKAKAHVQNEWQKNASEYEGKADFSRIMSGLVLNEFDVKVSAKTIADQWLKGK